MNPNRIEASVCICTHNGALRLGEVLLSLTRQTYPVQNWELIVINNASSDETESVACETVARLFTCTGRVVREHRMGLSFARARAALEARGEVVCFLDDDNLPSRNFIAKAIEAFAARPKAGVIGGRVIARWQTPPTLLAQAVAPFALAVCDRGSLPLLVEGNGAGILGAGLCARRDVLRVIFADAAVAAGVTDRRGLDLIGGGDMAISVAARQRGWECWYDPSLSIEHAIPARRMEKAYLLRLYEGIGRGEFALRKCYDWKARTPLAWLIGFKDLGRWAKGKVDGPSGELSAACQVLAEDLHKLHQCRTLARALQALSWPD